MRTPVSSPALHAGVSALVVIASMAAGRVVSLGATGSAILVAVAVTAVSFGLAAWRERAAAAEARAVASWLSSSEGVVPRDPVWNELVDLGAALRRRERDLAENGALLAAIVEMTPAALLLLGPTGGVVATNEAARALFFDGADVGGAQMVETLRRAPPLLRRVLAANGDELFEILDADGALQTYHLTKRHFDLGGDAVVLVMVSDMSREIARQEVDVYKRVIRVLAHEVNNSLAPIASLMYSAQLLVTAGDATPGKLGKVFATVAERAEHLRRFLAGYSELARLPLPRKGALAWPPLFERLAELFPGLAPGVSAAPPGWLDRAQIEQVLVNLIKNAEEAGCPRAEIAITVEASEEQGTRLVVGDRGRGMAPEVMKNALVPLFTTKPDGSGLGLAICREIVVAHGGVLRLVARDGGGLEVAMRFPPRLRAKVRTVSYQPAASHGTATRVPS